MTSNPPSGASTPRFVAQNATAEDLLKTQTVGLVNLADYKKRRADAIELKERELEDSARSGTNTPGLDSSERALTPNPDLPPAKKKKKIRNIVSYDDDEEEQIPRAKKKSAAKDQTVETNGTNAIPKKFRANPNSTLPPLKAMTKAAQAAEAGERERLRKEFLEMQEKVKNTQVAIPFVFYDGANIPGDTVKAKKGDHIWLILERARKIAAEKGVQGSGAAAGGLSSKNRDDSRRQWARIGVDDLMLVRGNIIVPHHYEIYYFIANKTPDPSRPGKVLFDYTGTVPEDQEAPLLRIPGQEKLEGHDDDPIYTKVVDRRWYERNKHIFPASTWKEFKVGKDFEETAKQRTDAEGNAFFFS